MKRLMVLGKNNQKGYVLIMTLALIISVGLLGSVFTLMATYDIKQSKRDFIHKKAEYVAEAALNWGLSLSRLPPPFTCSTHDSTGAGIDTTGGSNCNSGFDFLDSTNSWYPNSTPSRNFEGWITNSPLAISDALSGEISESMAFKVWFPNDSTVRIIGRGTVKGVSSTVNMFGNF